MDEERRAFFKDYADRRFGADVTRVVTDDAARVRAERETIRWADNRA